MLLFYQSVWLLCYVAISCVHTVLTSYPFLAQLLCESSNREKCAVSVGDPFPFPFQFIFYKYFARNAFRILRRSNLLYNSPPFCFSTVTDVFPISLCPHVISVVRIQYCYFSKAPESCVFTLLPECPSVTAFCSDRGHSVVCGAVFRTTPLSGPFWGPHSGPISYCLL